MSYFLWILACLVAYIGGIILIVKMTQLLLMRSFDEGLFMAIAAADIFGGMLAFGALVVPLVLFNDTAIRVVDVLLLLGILLIAIRQALRCFRPRFISNTFRVSRILAGCYSLLLAAAAIYYIIQLFTLTS